MINEDIAQEILHELFSSLEALETQSGAILQFLKDKGIASEKELAVYFEQAGSASNVRWRAARVRIDHLLSSAEKAAAQEASKSAQAKPSEKKQESSEEATKTSREKDMGASSKGEPEKETQVTEKVTASGKSEVGKSEKSKTKDQQADAGATDNRKESGRTGETPEHAANNDRSEDAPSRKTA